MWRCWFSLVSCSLLRMPGELAFTLVRILLSACHFAVGVLGSQIHAMAPGFTWTLGIQIQALMLVQQTLYLSGESSP